MESPVQPPARTSLSSNPGAMAALLLTPLFFSMNLVVARASVASISPWNLAFWRWIIAVAILLPFATAAMIRHRAVLRAEWKQLIILGFLVTVACGGNVYVALQYTTATNATLIYTTSTIMVVVLAAMLERRRLPAGQIVGAVAGFIGIALITLHGELQRLIDLRFNIGDLSVFVAALAWAIYSLMVRKGPLMRIGAVPAFTAIAIVGTALLVPPLLWENLHGGHAPAGPQAWLAVLALAIFPSVLAFILFQYCVKVAGAPVTAMFLYLLPIYGILMSVALLGEELHLYHAVGFVLILGGVALASRPMR
jgi:drug/metabolite transporter (DMT)-like permease